jgi:hypothetical protein
MESPRKAKEAKRFFFEKRSKKLFPALRGLELGRRPSLRLHAAQRF